MKFFDSCGDTTTTTGTGTLTGTGTAPTGCQTPTSAGVADGDTVIIRIQDSTNTNWEVCESTYTASGTTWSRGTLQASSTGSRVSFAAGTKNIYIVVASEIVNKIKSYAVTTTDNGPSGGTSEVDLMSVSVGANEFNDGDEIIFDWTSETLNNSGGSTNVTIKAYWNGNSITTNSTVAFTSSATVGQVPRQLRMKRIGTSVYITLTTPSTFNFIQDAFAASGTLGAGGGILTSQTFSGAAVAKFSLTFSVAGANIYYKVKSARCVKYAK